VISVVVNIAARLIARRGSSYAAPVGQGA
jgi:hypothetical protein